MNKKDNDRHIEKQDRRNTFVVGVVGGVLIGLICAMLLGLIKYSNKADEGITSWIQSLSGITATLVSVYAVYLVSQTLKATQETLQTTQRMADDQKRIGETQIRPWLLVSESSINLVSSIEEEIAIKIKNFGPTPARFITFSTHLWEDGEDNCSYIFPPQNQHYIAPGQDTLITYNINEYLLNRYQSPRLGLRVTYCSIDDKYNDLDYMVNFRIVKYSNKKSSMHLV